jgi:hypothetical protein
MDPEPDLFTNPDARGRCLCGAVTFEVAGALRDVINCHCERCRRFTGHHMAATAVDTAALTVSDSSGALRWFYPVPEAGYGYCSECGSSLFWKGDVPPDRISICAGVLDPPTGLRTVSAWWVSEASDYHDRPPLPEHETE